MAVFVWDPVTKTTRRKPDTARRATVPVTGIGRGVSGWRVWYTRPAESPLTLYSPMFGTSLHGVRPAMLRVRGRSVRAACPITTHEPPAAGCVCGVYAVANVVDGLYRARAMASNIRGRDSYNSWFPLHPRPGMVPVLGRVELCRAVEHDDVGTWCILADVKAKIGTATPVLRAAAAEIVCLYVLDDLLPTREATGLAVRLADTFGVPAVFGHPDYTVTEWDARPAGMRDEPWRSSYAVDAMLAGFTRDGRSTLGRMVIHRPRGQQVSNDR